MKHQFKRILALLLAAVMILGILPSVFAANVGPFKDVQDDAWYAPYVQAVYENGLMQGVSANKFNPEGTSTRAQVATVLYRIAGQPPVGGPATFTDLTADWYANPVAWAQKNGIVNGLTPTKFGPDENVTREQLVVMIHRYYGEPAGTGDLNAFPDAAKVSGYAQKAFAWAIGAGIINGSNGKLNPQGLATRAQFAKIICLSQCDHVWDEGKITKEPTCVASGIKTYTCTKCGDTETEPVAPTGEHSYKEEITLAPTCGSYGVKTLTCTVCGTKVEESIDPTGEHTPGCGCPITEKYGRVDELKEGDEVIIVCDSKNIALGADYGTSYYNPGVAVNPVDGIIETSDTTIVWTVGKEGDFYTLSYNGQKLGMGTEFTSITLGGVNYKWELREAENEATFYLANLDRDPSQAYYMQWYESKGYWSGYFKLNDELMALSFYVKGADPIEIGGGETTVPPTTDPDPEEEFVRVNELREGAEIIIVCDSRNIALGADYGTSYYNPGVAVEPVDGVIKNSDSTIVWTVGKEGDFYTLSYNGQKLGMGTEYTSMTLGGVNYKWELRAAEKEGTFYLANLDRDPSQAYYMQWYEAKTYWSGYYNLNDDLMALAFYEKDADPQPSSSTTESTSESTSESTADGGEKTVYTRVNELKEGDEIVIVCDSRSIALGADYGTSYYNPGVAVEVVDGKITTDDTTIVWTVGKEGEFYTFSYNGQKLGMGTEYTSMTLGGVNYKWNVSAAANEGTFYVTNPDRDPAKVYYMQWYEGKTYWSGYHTLNEELMALAFYAKDVKDDDQPCNHAWDEGKVTKEPTCTEIGVREFTCTLCDAKKTESIPATGVHTYENGFCTGCGKEETVVPPVPPHTQRLCSNLQPC